MKAKSSRYHIHQSSDRSGFVVVDTQNNDQPMTGTLTYAQAFNEYRKANRTRRRKGVAGALDPQDPLRKL